MVVLQKNLMQKQMDELLKAFATGRQSAQLSVAWIQSCRLALGMSLRQLAERIGVSAPALKDFEKREQTDTISIATLKKAAAAMDMELVYYFKPKDGSLKTVIKKQALKKANEIIIQSNQSMKLEDQETSKSSQDRELERLANDILDIMPRSLWD